MYSGLTSPCSASSSSSAEARRSIGAGGVPRWWPVVMGASPVVVLVCRRLLRRLQVAVPEVGVQPDAGLPVAPDLTGVEADRVDGLPHPPRGVDLHVWEAHRPLAPQHRADVPPQVPGAAGVAQWMPLPDPDAVTGGEPS